MIQPFTLFQLCELGNFSVHWALRCLRPPGTKGTFFIVYSIRPFTIYFFYQPV